MSDLYKEKEERQERPPVAFSTFKQIFGAEYNIGFYHPCKDQCQVCSSFNTVTGEQKQHLEAAQQLIFSAKTAQAGIVG